MKSSRLLSRTPSDHRDHRTRLHTVRSAVASAFPPAPEIETERRPGIDTVIVHRAGLRELHLSLRPLPGERPAVMLWRLDAALRAHGASVVKHDVFGSIGAAGELLALAKQVKGTASSPVTWVEGLSPNGAALAGMEVMAVAGVEVEPVSLDGQVVGRAFNDAWVRHCILGDIAPPDCSKRKPEQARQVFERLVQALGRIGMSFRDVVRTWFFLDDIGSWYSPFNIVRTEFFAGQNLAPGRIAASTGVGGRNPAGAALVAGAWAMQPLDGAVTVSAVHSPLQCPAPSYGSSFSRAIEIGTPDLQRLLISGTASIEPGGRTAYEGDIKGQVDTTMRVIDALLEARGLSFTHVTRATAYMKRARDARHFGQWCIQNRMRFPVVVTQCEICREDLLFELELDAIVTRPIDGGPVPKPVQQDGLLALNSEADAWDI